MPFGLHRADAITAKAPHTLGARGCEDRASQQLTALGLYAAGASHQGARRAPLRCGLGPGQEPCTEGACSDGLTEDVRRLLLGGAPFDAADNVDNGGKTPLHYAARFGRVQSRAFPGCLCWRARPTAMADDGPKHFFNNSQFPQFRSPGGKRPAAPLELQEFHGEIPRADLGVQALRHEPGGRVATAANAPSARVAAFDRAPSSTPPDLRGKRGR